MDDKSDDLQNQKNIIKPFEIGEKFLINGLVYKLRKKTKKDLVLRLVGGPKSNKED